MQEDTATKTVRDFMIAPAVCLTEDVNIHDAARLLIREHIPGAPVIDDSGALLGYFSEKDCFRQAFCCCYFQDRAGRVGDYMTQPVVSVAAEADVFDVVEMMHRGPYRMFPVIDADRVVVGTIGRREVLLALTDLW